MIVGIGTDLADIRRVQKILAQYGKRARDRLFTDREQAYCEKQAHPAWSYAKRFAAKEAVFKAFSGKFEGQWIDVEVLRSDGGPPHLHLPFLGASWLKCKRIAAHLSLSDEYPYALAFVIIEGEL